MATSYTSLLGLALPVTGELAGTWGDTVNNAITSLLDTAVAGTTTLSTDADVTLTTTTGASNQARQAILLCSGSRSALRTITAPAQSKIYAVVNNTTGGFAVKIVGAGPTTGVTVANGKTAIVIWNGSDFVEVAPATSTTATNLAGGAAGSLPYQTGAGATTFRSIGTALQVLQVNAGATAPEWVSSTGTGNVVRATSPTIDGTLNATGNVILGDATTDTVTMNGYVGVGGAGAANKGVYQRNTALTGSTQYGYTAEGTFASSATTGGVGFATSFATEAAAFTMTNAIGFRAFNVTLGAGSSITNQYGVLVDDQTRGTNNYGVASSVSSGSNKWNIYASGTADNYFAGRLLLGTTATANNISSEQKLAVVAAGSGVFPGLASVAYSGTTVAAAPIIDIKRSRGTTDGSLTVVAADDNLGYVRWWGADGAAFIRAAQISAQVDGSPSTNDMPGRLIFSTTADSASTPTERMRIDSAGNVGLGTTSPGEKLAVAGSAQFTDGSPNIYSLGTTGRILITANASGTTASGGGIALRSVSASVNASGLELYAGGSERLRVFSSGGVSIGDTTDPGAGGLRVTGNATLGDATTDTVTVNGYMGVGAAAGSTIGLTVGNTALTSTTQVGVYSLLTGTSAATSAIRGFTSQPQTAAAAFTCADVIGYNARNATKGAGSTITNLHGVYIDDQTQGTNNYGITSLVSSGTNKWNIYASGTAANYFAGQVLVGTTGSRTSAGITPIFQIESTTVNNSSQYLTVNNATAGNSAVFQFNRSKGTANGDVTAVASGDTLGRLFFAGADGTALILSAGISAQVDGTPGTNDMPGRLVFSTTADGAASLTERMRIDSSGNLGLGVTPSGSYKLEVSGASSLIGSATSGDYTTNQASQALPQGTKLRIANTQATTNTFAGFEFAPTNTSAQGQVCYIGGVSTASGLASGFVIGRRTGGATYAESLRIDSSGNVGIGTSAPATLLEVSASVDPVLRLNNSTNAVTTGADIGEIQFYTNDASTSGTGIKSFIKTVAGSFGAAQGAASLVFGTTDNAEVNATERMRIDSSGNVLVTGAGGLGYGTGSGGAVTQATSRTTGVTLDKTNGAITLVSAAGTTTWQSFTVTNNKVAATDVVKVCQKSGTDLYMIHVTAVAAGSFRITFATTGGTTTEQPVFNFAVIKAVTA